MDWERVPARWFQSRQNLSRLPQQSRAEAFLQEHAVLGRQACIPIDAPGDVRITPQKRTFKRELAKHEQCSELYHATCGKHPL